MSNEALESWLRRRMADAPPVLRDRVLSHAVDSLSEGSMAERLALVAERVLTMVEEHPGDRTIALDLLSADALITLALLAQSESAPEGLGAFAEALLAGERVG